MMKRILLAVLLLLSVSIDNFAISPQERAEVEGRMIDILSDDALAGGTETISRLKELLQTDPTNDAIHYQIAIRYYGKRQFKDALKEAMLANKYDPGNDVYKEMLATLYSMTGQHTKASEIYLALLKEKPQKYSNAYTLTLLADQQLEQGKDSLAITTYDQALVYEPNYAPALVAKAEIYRLRRNFASFFATMKPFTTSGNIEPGPKAQYVKAVLEHMDGRTYKVWHQQLDDMVEDCFVAHPHDSTTIKLAAEWFYSTGQTSKGEIFFYKLLDLYPDYLEAHYYILQIKSARHDLKGMIEEASKILALSKDTSDKINALGTLADCYYECGDIKQSYKCYEKVLKLNPKYAPALNNYAYFLCLEGKSLAKAEKMSKITIEQEPDNPTYLDTYGWILHLRGKDAQAKPYFKHAMLYGGKENVEVLNHFVAVLEKLGETEVASFYRSLAESKK